MLAAASLKFVFVSVLSTERGGNLPSLSKPQAHSSAIALASKVMGDLTV